MLQILNELFFQKILALFPVKLTSIVRCMNEKQILLTIVFIRLIQRLTSWTSNLNSQHFDLTTFRFNDFLNASKGNLNGFY